MSITVTEAAVCKLKADRTIPFACLHPRMVLGHGSRCMFQLVANSGRSISPFRMEIDLDMESCSHSTCQGRFAI